MNRNFSVFILFLWILSGCTVYREFPIDIYVPGEITIPPETGNAAIVYRNFSYPGDTLQNYYKSDYQLKKSRNIVEGADSVLVKACLQELAGELKTNQVFENVTLLPVDLFQKHSGEKLPLLNSSVVKQLSSSVNADILISLETFSCFFSEFSGNYDVAESNEVVSVSVWAVYDPANDKPRAVKTLIDTLYWNRFDENSNKANVLPNRGTALKIASQLAGRNFAKHFFASWQRVDRMYVVPPLPDFSDAAFLIGKGKWDEAIAIWNKYASEKNGKLAISARYNIALAYEMKDDPVTAMKWLNAAENLALSFKSRSDIQMILVYKKVLNQRIRQFNAFQSEHSPDAQ